MPTTVERAVSRHVRFSFCIVPPPAPARRNVDARPTGAYGSRTWTTATRRERTRLGDVLTGATTYRPAASAPNDGVSTKPGQLHDDFHRIAYAASADAARSAYVRFERVWAKRCPGVVASLREGGDELLTFFTFPKAQWKTLRTTNTIERLHEEFRRRVKTQGSLPSEDAAVVLLFSLVASGQIRLRRIDGWQKIATVLRQQTPRAA